MTLSYDEIHRIVIKLGFGINDFITSRNSRNIPVPISCISDVCDELLLICLLYTSPSPRDQRGSRMPSSA